MLQYEEVERTVIDKDGYRICSTDLWVEALRKDRITSINHMFKVRMDHGGFDEGFGYFVFARDVINLYRVNAAGANWYAVTYRVRYTSQLGGNKLIGRILKWFGYGSETREEVVIFIDDSLIREEAASGVPMDTIFRLFCARRGYTILEMWQ